jgi:D-glycero-alpha-D-manno-heptose 1-phosphate guanylyltransferase
MQVTEAIVLAGGLGTRLRDAVPNLPKCMAPVNGKPFISYVITHLRQQGIGKFIFSLGYKSEAFTQFLSQELAPENFEIAIEKEPLGTGGAIRFAAGFAKEENIVVVNGDSIFKTSLAQQSAFHFEKKADCTLALKPMVCFDRYGAVELNPDHRIALFKEKQFFEKGLINGGTYLLNIELFCRENLPEKFSFETDYLQQFYTIRNIYGQVQDAYFIDIGIPEDYQRAQTELK